MKYFCSAIAGNARSTFSIEADSVSDAMEQAQREAPRGATIALSVDCGVRAPAVTDWEAEGRRMALDSMDLPDGAYCAMADELGLDIY